MQRKSSKNSTRSGPDASERTWQVQVRSCGCAITGETPELHHVLGGSARINKLHIGEKFVLPLSSAVHRDLDRLGRDGWSKQYFGFVFVGKYDAEKLLFKQIVDSIGWPFDQAELEAIMSFTHR